VRGLFAGIGTCPPSGYLDRNRCWVLYRRNQTGRGLSWFETKAYGQITMDWRIPQCFAIMPSTCGGAAAGVGKNGSIAARQSRG
jgi:hypothetical protein